MKKLILPIVLFGLLGSLINAGDADGTRSENASLGYKARIASFFKYNISNPMKWIKWRAKSEGSENKVELDSNFVRVTNQLSKKISPKNLGELVSCEGARLDGILLNDRIVENINNHRQDKSHNKHFSETVIDSLNRMSRDYNYPEYKKTHYKKAGMWLGITAIFGATVAALGLPELREKLIESFGKLFVGAGVAATATGGVASLYQSGSNAKEAWTAPKNTDFNEGVLFLSKKFKVEDKLGSINKGSTNGSAQG